MLCPMCHLGSQEVKFLSYIVLDMAPRGRPWKIIDIQCDKQITKKESLEIYMAANVAATAHKGGPPEKLLILNAAETAAKKEKNKDLSQSICQLWTVGCNPCNFL